MPCLLTALETLALAIGGTVGLEHALGSTRRRDLTPLIRTCLQRVEADIQATAVRRCISG
jgi:hypothetical protein